MRSLQFPWVRIAVFSLVIAILVWWMFLRGDEGGRTGRVEPVAPVAPTAPPAAEKTVVVLDILAHEVEVGEHPTYWISLEAYGWDVEVPDDDASEEEKRTAAERKALAFAEILQELVAAREAGGGADVEGRVRRGENVRMDLTMEAFNLFMEAGYVTVEMETSTGRPPGAVGDR